MPSLLRVQKITEDVVRKRVEEVSGFLKISHLLDRLPGTYSGGERQRLAFARTMIRDPNLYMLDEPLANLDALIRLQMRIELKRIHQELEKTMLYVTHDQVEAMTMSDRIGVLGKGEVLQVGTPDEIYMKPVNRFVAGFFGSPPMNFLETDLDTGHGQVLLKWDRYAVEAAELAGRTGRTVSAGPVTLGIRPEDIEIRSSGESQGFLKGVVASQEQLGAKTVLDVALGSQTVRVSLGTTFDYKVNDPCLIRMNCPAGSFVRYHIPGVPDLRQLRPGLWILGGRMCLKRSSLPRL